MELIIYIKMDLALNNLQRLICHKTQQTKPNQTKPKLPSEMKIGYISAKVEKYPKRCLNGQKYGHLKNVCSRKPVCVKCGAHEPDHTEESCKNNFDCSNGNKSHRVVSKHWKSGKKIEILKIKVTQNITFPEARNLLRNFM